LCPVIDDGGFVVAESGAAVLYIVEKAGKLIPSDFEGAVVMPLATLTRPLLPKTCSTS
jgi:glutathione S-transferase